MGSSNVGCKEAKLMFALIDCNNFYASCERIFKPSLNNKPVAILSNNDGCIIARSNEVKALGIPMGAPLFKYKDIIKKHNVNVLSSNFELYGDISNRIMNTISQMTPNIEIYSIDECFINLSGITNLEQFSIMLRAKILKEIGVPISIGIGKTKVLAKSANYYAKKYSPDGYYIINESNKNQFLDKISVDDIWGVGRNLAPKLKAIGINTALQLASAQAKQIRKLYNVALEKIHLELNDVICFTIDEVPDNKKSIASTRSFGRAVSKLEDLEEALANYVATATKKLRDQQSLAGSMYIFIRTGLFQKDYYKNSRVETFGIPTNDTSQLISAAKNLLSEIYIPKMQYKKAGVILLDIKQESNLQLSMFNTAKDNSKLMQVIDNVNKNFGKNTLFFAAQGIKRDWQMKRENRSPRYTSSWDELLQVK